MPQPYFFPTGSSVAQADVVAHARASLARLDPDWRAGLDPAACTLEQPPEIVERDVLLASLPEEARATTGRYWDARAADLRAPAAEMLPPGAGALRFACLAGDWRGYPARTVVGVREHGPVGLLAVFAGWTVDGFGRLVDPVPRVVPAFEHRALVTATSSGDSVFTNSLPLIEYIAQGLVEGFPVLGKLLRFLLGVVSDAAKGAMDGGTKQLDAFAQELKASDAQLETDLASAHIMTYQFWAAGHYQDQWVADIAQGDPNSPTVQATRKTLAGFVDTVSGDFDDRNADVLTAVNLMMTEQPAPNTNLEYPTLAMLKASGFFFLANYVLTLGRQAFNAQLAVEGPAKAAVLGAQLVRLSSVYTTYATALKTAVDQQYTQRTGYLRVSIDTAHCFIDVIDDWDNNPANRPAAMRVWSEAYCGNDEYNRKLAEGRAELQRRLDAYRRSFWAGDPATRDQAVAKMQSNHQQLLALGTAP